MQDTNNNKRTNGLKLVLKSVAWTLIALSLMAIGYFGAALLFG